MAIEEILPSYYRYNLDQKLQEAVKTPPMKQDFLFVDLVMGIKPSQDQTKAPQDTGETKHPLVDEKRFRPEMDNAANVRTIEQTSAAITADQAFRYKALSRLNLFESRKNMENFVRRLKRARQECPYRNNDKRCTRVGIRCGERFQYSRRETTEQKALPHTCNYSPTSNKDAVLIVDSDPRVREFCKQALALFLGRYNSKITTLDSTPKAIELLHHFKMMNKQFGLVIVDASMPDNAGYRLVNEIFKRNYDVDVLLTRDGSQPFKPPQDYVGDAELSPNEHFVSVVLSKPFHSEGLINAVKKLRFGK